MANTVWIIETGHYSDYRVVGPFTSKENAIRVLGKLEHCEDPRISEVPLDPCINELNAGLWLYHINMSYQGETRRVAKEEGISSYNTSEGLRVWEKTKAPKYRLEAVSDEIHGTVWAEDEKHAIKIANEFRIQAIALGKMGIRENKIWV